MTFGEVGERAGEVPLLDLTATAVPVGMIPLREAAILAAQVVGAEVRLETGAKIEQPVEGTALVGRERVVGAGRDGHGDGRPSRHGGGQRACEQEGRWRLGRAARGPGPTRRHGQARRVGRHTAECRLEHVGEGLGPHVR